MWFLLAALFYLITYTIDDRGRDTLWFGLLCASVALLILAESWRDLFGYSYNYHATRLQAVQVATMTTCFLLTGFLAKRFFPRQAYRWMAAQVLLILLGYSYSSTFDGRAMGIMFGTLVLAQVLVLIALRQQQRGSLLAVLAVSICLILFLMTRHAFMDRFFFIAFGILLLGLMLAQTHELRARGRDRRDARLNAARLEIELLRRHIQPHFLLNSLTSLMEWLEQEPARGVSLVRSLAEELLILGRISGKTRIPIGEELALCRAHLAVMSQRRDQPFRLETNGLDDALEVPPALFHTLIENGVTHGAHTGNGCFQLDGTRDGSDFHFRLLAPGRAEQERTGEGTGLRYIKARLQESWPDRWTFEHGPSADGWSTHIHIREVG